MQVIEHQFLHYRNVLSYITQIDDDDISFFVVGVKNNICVLDLKLNGKIVFTKKDNFMEFVIPVNKKFTRLSALIFAVRRGLAPPYTHCFDFQGPFCEAHFGTPNWPLPVCVVVHNPFGLFSETEV